MVPGSNDPGIESLRVGDVDGDFWDDPALRSCARDAHAGGGQEEGTPPRIRAIGIGGVDQGIVIDPSG